MKHLPIGISSDPVRQRDADATHALRVALASSPTTARLETPIGKCLTGEIVSFWARWERAPTGYWGRGRFLTCPAEKRRFQVGSTYYTDRGFK
ncbi:MAG: hypothetical protein NZ874_02200 [Fimbriimonadales bacterium]|nr:hypothetical protein [Fimbriimonadales bacterium]